MRIRIAVPDAHVTPAVINAALAATTAANKSMLEAGEVPPVSHLIDRGRVRWKPEPYKDGEHFDLISQFKDRGWADCDDLAPALAAQLQAEGRDPGARAVVYKSSPKTWHAVTQLSDGRILDPSKAAGMGKERGVRGTSVMGSFGGAILGLKRVGDRWAARCDLPIDGTQAMICGVEYGKSPLDAITEAVDGATLCGEAADMVDEHDIARALAIQHACAGEDFGETLSALHGVLPDDEVGSIFSHIAHALKSVVPAAASFIPIPGAGLAAQALTHLIPGSPEHHAAQQQAQAEALHAAARAEEPPAFAVRRGVKVSRTPHGAFMIQF